MAETAPKRRKRNVKGKLVHQREISRFVARDRRIQEKNVLNELLEEIPLVTEPKVTPIDRIAQLRVAVTFVRLRGCVSKLMETIVNNCDEDGFLWSEETIASCLDGFVFICNDDGVILYVTESVSIFIGLTQTDLVGRMLKDFLNGDDYDGLCKAMTEQNTMNSDGRLIVMRIKSVIGPRGRKLKPKAALMKPMMFCLRSMDNGAKGSINLLQSMTIPALQAHLYSAISKRDTENSTFSTRHTCDMKFAYADESFHHYLKLTSETLMGTSFYDLVFPADLLELVKSFKELFKKTYCCTPYYRLVDATGAVSWVQTEANIVSNITRGQRIQYVICVHQLLGIQSGSESSASGEENENPAATAVQFKTEVDDSLDYLNFEPNTIECVGFIPLIDESTYRKKTRTETRTESFDEVLKWLVSDLPHSSKPNATLMLDMTDSKSSNSTAVSKYYRNKRRPTFVDSGTQYSPCPMEDDAAEFACPAKHMTEAYNEKKSSNFSYSNNSQMQIETCNPAPNLCTTNNRANADVNITHQGSLSTIPNADSSFGGSHEVLETLAPFVAQEEMMLLDDQGLLSDTNYDSWFETEMKPADSSPPIYTVNKVSTNGAITKSKIVEDLTPAFNLDSWFKAQKIMEMDDDIVSTLTNLGPGPSAVCDEKSFFIYEQFGPREQLSLNTDILLNSTFRTDQLRFENSNCSQNNSKQLPNFDTEYII